MMSLSPSDFILPHCVSIVRKPHIWICASRYRSHTSPRSANSTWQSHLCMSRFSKNHGIVLDLKFVFSGVCSASHCHQHHATFTCPTGSTRKISLARDHCYDRSAVRIDLGKDKCWQRVLFCKVECPDHDVTISAQRRWLHAEILGLVEVALRSWSRLSVSCLSVCLDFSYISIAHVSGSGSSKLQMRTCGSPLPRDFTLSSIDR